MPAYPGLGFDLRYHSQEYNDVIYPLGIHTNCHGSDSDMLLVREVAMMIVMEKLTDKPDWHLKVNDREIAARWRSEMMALPAKALWDEVVGGKGEYANSGLKPLQDLLDLDCAFYVIRPHLMENLWEDRVANSYE